MQALGLLALAVLTGRLCGALFSLPRGFLGPRFGGGLELQLPRLLLCLSTGGSALPKQLGVVTVRSRIRRARYFSEDWFRRCRLIHHSMSRFSTGIGLCLDPLCILSLDVGALLADLDVDCPLASATSTQGAH